MFMYCEDVDLSWRARQAGYGVKHAPRALFHHHSNRPGTNDVAQRAHLDAARYLATKWSNEEFVRQVEGMIASAGWQPRALPEPLPKMPVASVADFTNGLNFAPLRWGSPSPIPPRAPSRHGKAP